MARPRKKRLQSPAKTENFEAIIRESLMEDVSDQDGVDEVGSEGTGKEVSEGGRNGRDAVQETEVHQLVERLSQIAKHRGTSPQKLMEEVGASANKEDAPTNAQFWGKFDITKLRNAGEKLDFVPPRLVNGFTMGKSDVEDVAPEIEYWQHTVMSFVIGSNPPFRVIEGYFKRVWGHLGIEKVNLLQNGVYLVKFRSEEAKEEVLSTGIYHLDNKPLVVKNWSIEADWRHKEANMVPVWIQLPQLHLKY